MTTLFISDLHLQEQRPHLTRAFFDFLQQQAQGVDALYILGDFFNVWLGDDHRTPLSDEVASQLLALSRSGTAIYLMHGNRDFLIGQDFCQRSGATLLPDPSLIDLYGTPTLLMHGDSLCLDDAGYQRYRRIIRSRFIEHLQRWTPLSLKQRIADKIKHKSGQAKAYKAAQIMDVTAAEVERQMRNHHTSLLIHGHTHRPDRHLFTLDDQASERIVLGDWDALGWYLRCGQDGRKTLHSFSIPN